MNEVGRTPGSRDTKDSGTRSDVGRRVRELTSDELLQGAAEILIRHGQDQYRLRSTSKGKLILTK
tara:strand:- start:750 stop:944 length:195 start_codon:yes stop_codon:yes gene_type:complete